MNNNTQMSDEQIQKLAQFKALVHRRLDEMGIPAEPDGEHSKAGCRIGDRLDLVETRLKERFTKPLDGDIISACVLFNDGALDSNLTNMVAACSFIIDRLYENGDIKVPSSVENTDNDNSTSDGN